MTTTMSASGFRALRRAVRALPLAALTALAACEPIEQALHTPTPHERYAESLRQAGLADRELGRAWLAAAARAVAAPHAVMLPFRETGYFPADEARAAGYRFAARRGQLLRIRVETPAVGAALFLDLFEPSDDTVPPFERMESADSGTASLDVEISRDGTYLVRVQPELLRSVRWTLTVEAMPTLGFPVEGRDSRAIRSFYGAERDGGRREHQGVDIFAPRGTPVVAATSGRVRRVGVNRLGGNVVWLWDELRNQSLYYAHLDTQLVESGAAVRPGDTLGLVGNSGNARTTPPHLHFGIYRRGEGALDPLPFIDVPDTPPPPPLGLEVALDVAARVERQATLRAGPFDTADSLGVLADGTLVRVLGGNAAGWRRIALPNETEAFLRAADLEDARPRPLRLAAARPLREAPAAGALLVDSLEAGTAVAELGRFEDWRYVVAPDGPTGWLRGD